MKSETPMLQSEAISSADKTVNYNDFKTTRINPNYSFIKTDKMESGIAQTWFEVPTLNNVI